MTRSSTLYYHSPVGTLAVQASDGAIVSVALSNKKIVHKITDPLLKKCKIELDEYFAGTRTAFSLPLAMHGTEFQRAVWQATADVPYGALASYKDIARSARKPAAARAVGNVCNANRLLIIIPCHRIVHSDGRTSGYALGAETKMWLLEHERKRKAANVSVSTF